MFYLLLSTILRRWSIVITIYQPYTTPNEIYARQRPKNLHVAAIDGKVTIQLINPNSNIYQQGVRKGDIITAINGELVTDFCQFVNLYEKVQEKTSYAMECQDKTDKTTIVTVRN